MIFAKRRCGNFCEFNQIGKQLRFLILDILERSLYPGVSGESRYQCLDVSAYRDRRYIDSIGGVCESSAREKQQPEGNRQANRGHG